VLAPLAVLAVAALAILASKWMFGEQSDETDTTSGQE
jgi:hypothetical protein